MAQTDRTKWDLELDEHLLQDLYAWIDQVPLSRSKRRIERDFSDGVMVAELVKYYFPNWVELHNYTASSATQQKMINWGLLNRKVFQRFDLNVPEHVMRGICLGKSGLVETFLYNLRVKIDDYLYGMETNTSDPEYRNLFRKEKEQSLQNKNSQLLYDEPYDNQQSSRLQNVSKQPLNKAANALNQPKKPNLSNMVNEVVPRIYFEEKEQELLAKEEELQIMTAKVRRLEHLLHLKDVRIQDLTEKNNQLVKSK